MSQFTLQASDAEVRVALAPVLDLGASAPFKDALIEAMEHGKKVTLDASDVQRMSTACVQVFVAAGKTLEEAGLERALYKPTEAVVDAFNELGLFPELMKWKVEV